VQRVPGGRDGDEGPALLAALEADLAARLPRRLPFPVLAPTDPPLRPGFLAEAHWSDETLERVALAAGDLVRGPLIVVSTQPLGGVPRPHLAACEDALELLRAGPWDAAADLGPAQPLREVDVTFAVAGLPGGPSVASVRGLEDGDLWAAALDLRRPRLRVVVAGRAVPHGVRLETVTDLAPWVAARTEALAVVRASGPQPVEPEALDLPPAQGFEAHEALVELVCGVAAGIEERVRFGRRTRGLPADWAVVWERATRAQMHLASQGRQEATDAVTALANHVSALDEERVLGGDPVLRAAAVGECVRWTAFASQVPSEPAQHAWQERWVDRSAASDLRWRSAWADWMAARSDAG
jgi:hypothetical protein